MCLGSYTRTRIRKLVGDRVFDGPVRRTRTKVTVEVRHDSNSGEFRHKRLAVVNLFKGLGGPDIEQAVEWLLIETEEGALPR